MNFRRNSDPLLDIGGTHNRAQAFKVHNYGDIEETYPYSSGCRVIENRPPTEVVPYDQDLEEPWTDSAAPCTAKDIGNRALVLTAPEEFLKSQSSQVS